MNCEQVEELLSAYLDVMLASEELRSVATHLQSCTRCSSLLDEYRHFDTLIAHLPRVSPEPALDRRIFSSREYQDFLAALKLDVTERTNRPTVPYQSVHVERETHPHLVTLPRGHSLAAHNAATRPVPVARRRPQHFQRIMYTLIAATLFLTLSVGAFISWNLLRQGQAASNATSITPPAVFSQTGPLPAGIYFIFLRNGALWSASTMSSPLLGRLTPSTVTVSANWAVRPALPGHSAGNMLAYIDLQQGLLHVIRSDGQNDLIVPLPLLQADVAPAAAWDTSTGQTILTSLAWSPDGTRLAFVADPHNTSQPGLYIYSMNNNTVQSMPLPTPGAVSLPVWSSDGIHIAFTLTNTDTTQIIDYNTQNHSLLTMASYNTATFTESILTLAWSPTGAITWSIGSFSHIHTIFVRSIDASQPHILANGDFTQALYDANGIGNWLLVNIQTTSSSLQTVSLDGNTRILASSPTIGFVQWSPNGAYIDYLDTLQANTGTLHSINLQTLQDTSIATAVSADQQPAWSSDSHTIAYKTNTDVFAFNTLSSKVQQLTRLPETTAILFWSLAIPSQLLIAGSRQGCYIFDTQHMALTRLTNNGLQGPIQWTQIP